MSALRAVVVGIHGIGRTHAKALAGLPQFDLVALCDINPEIAEEVSDSVECPVDTDFAECLKTRCPDVVVIATPNASHKDLTIMAAEAGVKGIYCEKPMAVHFGDAQKMVDVCRKRSVALVVNHQRRMLPVFRTMKKLMWSGKIGEIEWIRASCAGDILSDGTHLIDSLRFLADSEAEWVNASIFRSRKDPLEPKGAGFQAIGGYRFGHPVEDAAQGVIHFRNGVRTEFTTGNLFPKDRWYQDFEVFGSKGRIWRQSDSLNPQLQYCDGSGGGWKPVPLEDPDHNKKYRLFARMVLEGIEHPLSGDEGLKDMELVTAIYESARIRDRVHLPVTQKRFPLEIMIGDGQI